MRDRKRINRGGAMLEFTLLIPVWLPLLLGTMWIGTAMVRGLQVTQVARDLASMFCRAVDFSATGTSTAQNDILPKLTQELGTVTSTGTGVVIFSTLTYVGASVCQMAGSTYYDSVTNTPKAACTNWKKFVFTQQYTVGNTSLRSSSFGGPATADPDATNQYKIPIVKYVANAPDQVTGFSLLPSPDTDPGGYQSGQPVYLVEVFFSGVGQVGYTQGGSYAYAIF
jgi:Flp pilus assembly protein TadG